MPRETAARDNKLESFDPTTTSLPVLAAQALGALAGGTVGLALGPVGSIGGAAFGQGVLGGAVERVITHRRCNAERTLSYAAVESGLEDDELVERLTRDPARIQLLGSVLDASTTAIAEEKLYALGTVLASGALTEDDATLSTDLQLARALLDIEVPQLRVLNLLYPRAEGRNYWNPEKPRYKQAIGYSMSVLKQEDRVSQSTGQGIPQFAEGMEGLLGTLQRHGLVVLRSGDWTEALERIGDKFSTQRPQDKWFITALGCRFHELVSGTKPGGA